MADPRPQQLTTENNIVFVVETTVVDLIAVNSGTCTGSFQADTFLSNTISNTGSVTSDHLVANSGTFTSITSSNCFQGNEGLFTTSLTVSGIPVNLEGGGISSIQEDTSPVLGGNLNANSNNITGVAGITANTGNFPVSCTAGTYSGNTMSLALTGSMDHLVANSGTYTGQVRLGNVLKLNPISTSTRNSLTAEEGMLIINSTTGGINYYVNGGWREVVYI